MQSTVCHIRFYAQTTHFIDCSPTNLLPYVRRSVYIYDFENSIPYFYVDFFFTASFFMASHRARANRQTSTYRKYFAICAFHSFIHRRFVLDCPDAMRLWGIFVMVNSFDCRLSCRMRSYAASARPFNFVIFSRMIAFIYAKIQMQIYIEWHPCSLHYEIVASDLNRFDARMAQRKVNVISSHAHTHTQGMGMGMGTITKRCETRMRFI